MKNSLIKRTAILITGILVTSLLFFIMVSATYDTFHRQSVLKDNIRIATNWTASIDNRLSNLYEHLYDLSTAIYKNTDIRPGSPEMDFTDKNDFLDFIETKKMASKDITAIFVVDSESDMYLYSNSGVVANEKNTYLKVFLRQYCLENNSSINTQKWTLIRAMDNTYYYLAMRMGKYIIGAVSDARLYQVDFPYEEFEYKTISTYLLDEDDLFFINGNDDLYKDIDRTKNEAYFVGKHVIVPSWQQNAKAKTVFINQTESIFNTFRTASYFMIADSAICVGLVFIMYYNIRKRVNRPIRALVKANKNLSDGNFDYKLDTGSAGSDEFEELYRSYNEMSEKIEHLTIEQYDAEIKRQQNQLKMLRAQVKPHTFLNAINTINNMTYTGKAEDIRKYISAFASFTRYMMYKAKDWTTVEDEVKNIESYTRMQQIRFPESIAVIYDIDQEIYSEQIPYLILFSLVENSFKHAMTLTDKAYITIKGEYYEEENFKGFRLIEEDNGPGFSKEALEKIETAEADDPFTKEHLGLTNVRYSLNLIYKRDDLLRISNREEGGAHIELLIPDQEVDDETFSM